MDAPATPIVVLTAWSIAPPVLVAFSAPVADVLPSVRPPTPSTMSMFLPEALTAPLKSLVAFVSVISVPAFKVVSPVLTVRLLTAVWVIAPVVASAFNALAVIAPSSTRLLPAFAVNKPLAVVSFMVKLFASRMLIFEPVADTGD